MPRWARSRSGRSSEYQNKINQARLDYDRDRQRRAGWQIAEGPMPERVWEDSTIESSFGRGVDGAANEHLRQYGNGHYMQTLVYPGWRFFVAIPAADDVPPTQRNC